MKKVTVIAAVITAGFCAASLTITAAGANTVHKGHHHAAVKQQTVDPMATADSGMMWHDAAGPKVQHGMCWATGGGKHGEGYWKACK